jgi:lactoylglutathione lyase
MRLVLVSALIALLAVGGDVAAESSVGGIDHVGLAVTDLGASERFFTETLGFTLTRRDDDYPAVFMTNGSVIVTLWRVQDPATAVPFDRRNNVGLHHLAFAVESFAALDALHGRLEQVPNVRIEFAPEPLSGGPAKHMMIREPSGNRLEFIHRPR